MRYHVCLIKMYTLQLLGIGDFCSHLLSIPEDGTPQISATTEVESRATLIVSPPCPPPL